MVSLNFILDLFFPKLCLGCKIPGTYLCQKCQTKIFFTSVSLCPLCEKPSPHGLTHPSCQTRFSLDGMLVLADYRGLMRLLIQKIKYKSVYTLTETLAGIFCKTYPEWPFTPDYVTFIPLHPTREKERGFNQAELLAEKICKTQGFTLNGSFLVRVKKTVSQMSIGVYSKRKSNVSGAFVVLNAEKLVGKTIAVVDDVSTTGATIFETAKVLKMAGVKTVWGIVIARKIPARYATL